MAELRDTDNSIASILKITDYVPLEDDPRRSKDVADLVTKQTLNPKLSISNDLVTLGEESTPDNLSVSASINSNLATSLDRIERAERYLKGMGMGSILMVRKLI